MTTYYLCLHIAYFAKQMTCHCYLYQLQRVGSQLDVEGPGFWSPHLSSCFCAHVFQIGLLLPKRDQRNKPHFYKKKTHENSVEVFTSPTSCFQTRDSRLQTVPSTRKKMVFWEVQFCHVYVCIAIFDPVFLVVLPSR